MTEIFDKPWLFLDVDGVIIPGGAIYPIEGLAEGSQPEGTIAIDVQPGNFPPCRAFVPVEIAAHLVQLSQAFDIVWATSWAKDARQLEEKLGIEAGHCLLPLLRFKRSPAKGEAVAEFLDGHAVGSTEDEQWEAGEAPSRMRPFAWVDDQLGSEVNTSEAIRSAKYHDIEWLGIVTNEQTGLTAAQTAALLAFAGEIAAQAAAATAEAAAQEEGE